MAALTSVMVCMLHSLWQLSIHLCCFLVFGKIHIFQEFCQSFLDIMPKRKCTFTDELAKKFDSFSKLEDPTRAYCNLCGTSISVAYRGLFIFQNLSVAFHFQFFLTITNDIYHQKFNLHDYFFT